MIQNTVDKLYVTFLLMGLLLLNACGTGTEFTPPAENPVENSPSDYSQNRTPTLQLNCRFASSIDLSTISDEYLSQQFYLDQMQVKSAWQKTLDNRGCLGNGITVSVVDNAVDARHEDLQANMDIRGSRNFRTGRLGEVGSDLGSHGTSVAGIIAAAANGFGVVGIANQSKIQSHDYLNNQVDSNLILAMQANADISNNSWGPTDGFATLSRIPSLLKIGIDYGIENGRNGRGIIYTWAAGNGRFGNDNSNYDGFANYRKVIAVAALSRNQTQNPSSENGANLLVSAPGRGLYTTRRTPINLNNILCFIDCRYTPNFSDTSGATPMVSGVVALLISAYPQLGWRDVRAILVRSATRNDPTDNDWTQNGADLWVNHKYGYGLVNANAALQLASTWRNLGDEIANTVSKTFTTNNQLNHLSTAEFTLTVASEDTAISQLESVEISIDSDHSHWADLRIELISPQGSRSVITESHRCGENCRDQRLTGFVFSSARLIGENPVGDWRIIISDNHPLNSGRLNKITLNFYGT